MGDVGHGLDGLIVGIWPGLGEFIGSIELGLGRFMGVVWRGLDGQMGALEVTVLGAGSHHNILGEKKKRRLKGTSTRTFSYFETCGVIRHK